VAKIADRLENTRFNALFEAAIDPLRNDSASLEIIAMSMTTQLIVARRD
jgi:hypothetical protein